ncbi:cobalamin-binding protein [Catenovulum adriaticum]|uniref:Cobalamin-binding protein n=1 Tax=Catenovulum adriaticum TaxID=2984846 RepID=A0ABY7APQ4_9ALTE|nr:cobalamin-binding protein [Catenovulum sp. TS8]WAJ71553.1 cobalamin-binding protein [Catenovulum sp. TS8]
MKIKSQLFLIVKSLLLLLTFSFSLSSSAADNKAVRLVVAAPHIVEMLYAIGAGDSIIGTTEHSDYPQAATKIPRIGNYAGLQVERILQLKPDYIVAWKTGNPEVDLNRLEKLGMTVVYSNPTDLKSVADELIMLGELTGQKSKANQIATAYMDKLNRLKQKYKTHQPISVFYQLWTAPLTTVANNAWPQQLLAICQVDNPFIALKGDYPQLSIEHVMMAKPKLIIIPTSTGEPNQIKGYWQQFNAIPAVKNKQIITVNSDKLHRMTPRALDELEVMCEKIDNARAVYF